MVNADMVISNSNAALSLNFHIPCNTVGHVRINEDRGNKGKSVISASGSSGMMRNESDLMTINCIGPGVIVGVEDESAMHVEHKRAVESNMLR